MAGRRILLLALAAALAGCSAGGAGPQDNRSTSARAATPAQSTAPARPRADLQDLLDADEARVDGYLGRPRIVRNEGAGEMRMYRSEACVVHVFLFPRAGRLTAAHVEARAGNRRLDPDQTDACIASFS
ncbi:MAG: hypothetical protein JJ899_07780 [Alphaproteobacteria bacterium]|nr:hypothetical protein [Alphaproteobacteria bacterium]